MQVEASTSTSRLDHDLIRIRLSHLQPGRLVQLRHDRLVHTPPITQMIQTFSLVLGAWVAPAVGGATQPLEGRVVPQALRLVADTPLTHYYP